MRDCLKTTGCTSFGLCVTCSRRYHIKLLQAGHFISGRHNANLFSERGTHAQCYNCNINLRGNTLIYRRKILEMYGEDADEKLEVVCFFIILYHSRLQLPQQLCLYIPLSLKRMSQNILGGTKWVFCRVISPSVPFLEIIGVDFKMKLQVWIRVLPPFRSRE